MIQRIKSEFTDLQTYIATNVYKPKCTVSQKAIKTTYYEGESIKKQPNLFLGEIDLFFFDVIAL